MKEHICDAMPPLIDIHDGHGEAITMITYNVKLSHWMAGNGEYGTAVMFCPFCGCELNREEQDK